LNDDGKTTLEDAALSLRIATGTLAPIGSPRIAGT
jgi:hypothetical protein